MNKAAVVVVAVVVVVAGESMRPASYTPTTDVCILYEQYSMSTLLWSFAVPSKRGNEERNHSSKIALLLFLERLGSKVVQHVFVSKDRFF